MKKNESRIKIQMNSKINYNRVLKVFFQKQHQQQIRFQSTKEPNDIKSKRSNPLDLNAYIKYIKDNIDLDKQLKNADARTVRTNDAKIFENDTKALLKSIGLSTEIKRPSRNVKKVKEPKVGKIIKVDEIFAPKHEETKKSQPSSKLPTEPLVEQKNEDVKPVSVEVSSIKLKETRNEKELEKFIDDEISEKENTIIKKYAYLANEIDTDLLTLKLPCYPIFGKDNIDEYSYIYNDDNLKLINKKLVPLMDCKKYPSVSNILFLTETEVSRNTLKKWKKTQILEKGWSDFNDYQKNMNTEGQLLHKAIEDYLKGMHYDQIKIDSRIEPAWLSLTQTLTKDIEKSISIESPLYHPSLCYQGRVDAIINYKGTLFIADWKKSSLNKRKDKVEDLYDNPLQMVAYLGAYLNDPHFEQIRKEYPVKQTMLINVYTNGQEPSIHCLSFHQTLNYWSQFLKRVQKFWLKIQSSNLLV